MRHNNSPLPKGDIRRAIRGFDEEDYAENQGERYRQYEDDRLAVIEFAEKLGVKSKPVAVGHAALNKEIQIDS